MTMRSLIVAGALLLASAGGAFAQSGQGGYLGIDPGAHQVAAPSATTWRPGSGQGGYLGIDPGAHLSAAPAATPTQGSGEGGYLGMIPGSASTGQEIVPRG